MEKNSGGDALTPEVQRAVQIIVRELGRSWEFGFWNQEELLQQAYVWAIEKLPQWDPQRGGNVYTFLRVVIRRQLINLRRDKFERQETPCKNCPLGAYLPPDGCSAFEDKRNCELWEGWVVRNERKKSLMSGTLMGDVPRESRSANLTEVRDELEYYRERVRDQTGFDLLAEGKPLSKVRKNSLLAELAKIQEDRCGRIGK